jgi:diguanylate cyclase (GGDEF)-like protein
MKLQGSNLLERKEIDHLINNGLNFVWFPKKLELNYCMQYRNEAANEFRYRGPIIFALYVFLSLGIYQLLPSSQVLPWLILYGWVGIIVSMAWLMTFFDRLNQWFDWYVGIGSALAVAITFIVINILPDGQNNVLFHAAMMYAVVIIYGFVGMRFYTAVMAGWIGGLIGVIVSTNYNGNIEWTLLHRTYTFSSFLGMCLVYANDRQHRENYLQSCLIELNRLELVHQAKQMAVLSRQDSLTGLANRRYLDEVVRNEWNRAMRHETSLTVMMVDIDYFKLYNDSLGHLSGDQCLKKVAEGIASVAARSGDLAARYGGEEFFLIFAMTDEEQAIAHAERLLRLIKGLEIAHPASEVSQYVTVSIGVASIIPKLSDHLSDFIASADHALYQAKTNGRNQYVLAKPFAPVARSMPA